MPSYPVLPPGATTDVPGSAITVTGVGATPASGELWDVLDNNSSTIVATASSPGTAPNDWGIAKDGTGGFNTQVPGSASQGGTSPRYRFRLSATFMA